LFKAVTRIFQLAMATRRNKRKTPFSKDEAPQPTDITLPELTSMRPQLDLKFIAKTIDAFHFKVTGGLLNDNIQMGCFKIGREAITLRAINTNGSLLIKLFMGKTNFNVYDYESSSSKVLVGLRMTHFNRMLKSIKKKDTLGLKVKGNSELQVQTSPKDNTRKTTSFLRIQTVQQVRISVPKAEYPNCVLVPSSEFNKMIKDMSTIGPKISIYFTRFYIRFECESPNIFRRVVEFGKKQKNEEEIMQEYSTELLNRISKVSGLNPVLQISTCKDMPLLIKSSIGTSGQANISLYVKNNLLIAPPSSTSSST
jgi:proliferating cell nuclear antigen